MTEFQPDEKAIASFTFGDVIRRTSNNFPDSRFRPATHLQTAHYSIAGINPYPYEFRQTADGTGTKPELAERLYDLSLLTGKPEPELYYTLPWDLIAMVTTDDWRFGMYPVGVANIFDANTTANSDVVSAAARGLCDAATEEQVAIINGETAVLGYRTSGYGKTRLNWNAVAVSIFNKDKLILGDKLKPGQPVIALRETSIRSNGLTKAREIAEADFLAKQGMENKTNYLIHELERDKVVTVNNKDQLIETLSRVLGHDVLEQVLTPWHVQNPEIARELLAPSRLYGKAMYAVLGNIDDDPNIDMTGVAHISGGGIPEKGKRMVEPFGLGIALDSVFPDPKAVTSLMNIVSQLPFEVAERLKLNDRIACEQWNRGIGLLVATSNSGEANKFVNMVEDEGYEAAIAGEITDKPQIQFRGHTWTYAPTAA